MNNLLLIHEPPLQVLPSLAVAVGLNEAIILQQMHYWLQRSDNIINGHLWVYNSVVQWNKQFPFWSDDTIARALKSLRTKGVVIAEHLSENPRDRSLYYRIDYDVLQVLAAECITAICGNGYPQFAVMDTRRLRKSLYTTETTTETTTERKGKRAPAPATPPAPPTPIAAPKEPKPKSKTTTTYPTDFAPDTTAQALAQNLGLNLDEEHPRFADHHASKGTRMADWQAAFRNWLRNSAKYAQSEKAPSKAASAASNRQNGAGNTLAQHLADCRSKSVKAIPEDHPVRAYMDTVGLDNVMQQIAWLRFADEHTTGRSKDVLCADWPSRFADSVRGRWYKLWFIDAPGIVQLTTEGQQALRWYDAQQQERDGGAA